MATLNIQGFVRTCAGDFGNSQAPVDYNYDGARFGQAIADINVGTFFIPVKDMLKVGSTIKITATDSESTIVTVLAVSSLEVVLDTQSSTDRASFYYLWMIVPPINSTTYTISDAHTVPLTDNFSAFTSPSSSTNTVGVSSAVCGTGDIVITFSAATTVATESWNVMVFKPPGPI